MPIDGAEPTSSSVSPKAVVPSITIVSLLVLITFVGAVVIFVRSYKKRRHSPDVEKQTTEDGEARERRAGNRERRGSIMGNGARSPRGYEGPGGAIRPPPRAAERGFTVLPEEGGEDGNQAFHKGRGGNGEAEEAGTEILERSSIPVASIGKIERITGNALSNDFYSDRASGSGHSRGNSVNTAAESGHNSYSSPSTKNIAPVLSFRPLALDTSPARDFSPYNEHTSTFKHSPLPAVIAPDMTTPVSASHSAESTSNPSTRSSSRFSYTQLHLGTNLGKHISTQYNRLKEPRKPPREKQGDVISLETVPAPQLPPFSDFNINQKPSRPTRLSSQSMGVISPVEPAEIGHSQRLSWNGRSVLELDAPGPSKQYNSTPPPKLKPRVLRRTDRNLPAEPIPPPKFATSPQARTSAFGLRHYSDYPPPPPIPPDPNDVAGGPGEFVLPMPMFRSASNSKMSVVSTPSSVSSINTYVYRNTIGGLSPTPALRNSPDYEDVISSNRKSAGGSTVLTETSEISNMTEVELEMEMRKIRERARRASEERRGARRRSEENQGNQRGAEVGSMPRIGHRFF